MNKNKDFETIIFSANRFDPCVLPKNTRQRVRTAKVGAGVVILPDNGNPITANEIVKALGLKDVEPVEEKEERTNIIVTRYNDDSLYISLTKSQIRLLDWLDAYGLLNDMEYGDVNNSTFEKI